ncbi:tyrosine protein phosphatase yvh1 [Balamuthia mandrillaris]
MEQQANEPVSLRDQLSFNGTTECELFVPNPFKPVRCKGCGEDIREHVSSAVADEHILYVIREEQAKDGANCILHAADGWGGLYLGGYQAATANFVNKANITHVVNTAKGLEYFFVGWGKKLFELEKDGLKILRLGWLDNGQQKLWKEEPWDQLKESILFIHEARKAGHNVVVHCAQGKSRSTTVVLAYLMTINKEAGYGPNEALTFVKQHRPMAEPNPNFMEQLQAFRLSPVIQQLRSQCT